MPTQLSHFPTKMLSLETRMATACIGVPVAYKSCSHFAKILLTSADLKSSVVKGTLAKIGYSIQGLVAKVRIQLQMVNLVSV